MNEKDAAVIKVLAELGLYKQLDLTKEQQQIFDRAVNKDKQDQFYDDLLKIFGENNGRNN